MTASVWSESPTYAYDLVGLEVDNLLAFLALMGLLRALEKEDVPAWNPKVSWTGPPWRARLHLSVDVSERAIAEAASHHVERIADLYDDNNLTNVTFERADFTRYAKRMRSDPVRASLASALTAEHPPKRTGTGLQAAPLVMLFGQGHQNFLERLLQVPRGELPSRHRKQKKPPNFKDPAMIGAALFSAWRRRDDADGFRWDPEDDQRYAFRYGDPSSEGAAPTVHGANRLAAIGLLSFACVPGSRLMARGAGRDEDGVYFAWPVWTEPLARFSIERLLSHPDVIGARPKDLALLGVAEVYRARRVANGKFMNVTRAMPVRSTHSSVKIAADAGSSHQSGRIAIKGT